MIAGGMGAKALDWFEQLGIEAMAESNSILYLNSVSFITKLVH